MQKAYLARVLGCFPAESVIVDKHVAWDSRSNHAFLMNPDGTLAKQQSLGKVPLPTQSQGLQAKDAQTSFKLLSVAPDGRTSLVECLPKTGRTHQIRCTLRPFTCKWLDVAPTCGRNSRQKYAASAIVVILVMATADQLDL